jgi:acetyl esterase/lipase
VSRLVQAGLPNRPLLFIVGLEEGRVFPAAVEDSVAAARWVAAEASALGVDAGRLAVGGDSAGGNLAAVVTLLARDAGGPAIASQLLIYPATDQQMKFPSLDRNGEGYLLTRQAMHYFRGHYLPRAADWLDWRASPLLAGSLAGLPPAYVLTAGYDPLVDEGKAYADRLAHEGVKTNRDYPDMIHGFVTMDACSTSPAPRSRLRLVLASVVGSLIAGALVVTVLASGRHVDRPHLTMTGISSRSSHQQPGGDLSILPLHEDLPRVTMTIASARR